MLYIVHKTLKGYIYRNRIVTIYAKHSKGIRYIKEKDDETKS